MVLTLIHSLGMATVQQDIFKPTKYGGKYTVTLIPGIIPVCLRALDDYNRPIDVWSAPGQLLTQYE
jgi:hypothetical protein